MKCCRMTMFPKIKGKEKRIKIEKGSVFIFLDYDKLGKMVCFYIISNFNFQITAMYKCIWYKISR